MRVTGPQIGSSSTVTHSQARHGHCHPPTAYAHPDLWSRTPRLPPQPDGHVPDLGYSDPAHSPRYLTPHSRMLSSEERCRKELSEGTETGEHKGTETGEHNR